MSFSSPTSAEEEFCNPFGIIQVNEEPSLSTLSHMAENLFCKLENGLQLLDVVKNPIALEYFITANIDGNTIDPNSTNEAGRTPLFYVENIDSARILINAGADPFFRDRTGETPLFTVRNPHVIAYFLSMGMNSRARNSQGKTALHEAEGATVVSLLVDSGADINAQDTDGNTPLHSSAGGGHTEAFAALLARGANYRHLDDLGNSILHNTNSAEIIQLISVLLLQNGLFDIDIRNHLGNTPLHTAAFWNDKEAIETLLDLGAAANIKNNEGQTPFELIKIGCQEVGWMVDCLDNTELYWKLNDLRFE